MAETLARVLVVDDEPAMREALTELLSGSGFEIVGAAGDGHQAVDLSSSLRPDLVLMDLRMPVMDGIEATRHIKELAPETQVLILSAYDDAELRRAGADAGIYCYLVKGGAPSLIVDMLEKAKAYRDMLLRRSSSGS
jgi:DNA-binding NarL/FixJ family response regulator